MNHLQNISSYFNYLQAANVLVQQQQQRLCGAANFIGIMPNSQIQHGGHFSPTDRQRKFNDNEVQVGNLGEKTNDEQADFTTNGFLEPKNNCFDEKPGETKLKIVFYA